MRPRRSTPKTYQRARQLRHDCGPAEVIIEVDGSQHLDQEEFDDDRIAFLESQGYSGQAFAPESAN